MSAAQQERDELAAIDDFRFTLAGGHQLLLAMQAMRFAFGSGCRWVSAPSSCSGLLPAS
jgi:hypothetical protein